MKSQIMYSKKFTVYRINIHLTNKKIFPFKNMDFMII